MPRPPCRKFTLADIMILVGFTAGGLALARLIFPTLQEPWFHGYVLGWGTPILSAWTVALLVLRMRRPRPLARHLFRQPGAAACLVSLIVIAIWTSFCGLGFAFRTAEPPTNIAYHAIGSGASVLGAWSLLLVSRTGRRERGWIDRWGRILGAGWIAMMLIVLSLVFFW